VPSLLYLFIFSYPSLSLPFCSCSVCQCCLSVGSALSGIICKVWGKVVHGDRSCNELPNHSPSSSSLPYGGYGVQYSPLPSARAAVIRNRGVRVTLRITRIEEEEEYLSKRNTLAAINRKSEQQGIKNIKTYKRKTSRMIKRGARLNRAWPSAAPPLPMPPLASPLNSSRDGR